MKVLITRPEPDASAFAALCASRGLAPVVAPLMEIAILKQEIGLSGVGALVFTSANGVRAFAANSAERNLPVFAIGQASAEAARAEGFSSVTTAGGDIGALSQLIVRRKAALNGAVLHIAGTHRAGDLVEALAKAGLNARRDVFYEARAVGALPDAARAALDGAAHTDWVALFSPRSAALFVSLVYDAGLIGALSGVRAACLSAAVAEKAGAADWKSIEIAAESSAAAMTEMMTRA